MPPEKQAAFALRGRNPDVLTCIANLSNDEVFTPPVFAARMLDTLAEAWAADHDGANLWANKDAKFLDPCAKSGVFLREITSRLTMGLANAIPDLQVRVDHILTKQVFGIGITQLTSLLTRRSLYCSKYANGEHSIASSFNGEHGNVWFERTEHTYVADRCKYCGAGRKIFDRGEGLETHAYALIHTDDVKTRIAELFGDDMQFDVVIGNPPYQMTGAAGGGVDSSIYHLFVDQAKHLAPRYVSMVIPARWMAGGRGVGDFDGFRQRMLGDGGTRELVDFQVASEVFPGVEVKGGICYFLWDGSYDGETKVTTVRGNDQIAATRALDDFDVFVRDARALTILQKIQMHGEKSILEILTNKEPFKFETNFAGYHKSERPDDLPLYLIVGGKRTVGYIEPDKIEKNRHLVDTFKLLVPQAYGAGETVPHQIVGKPIVAPSPSVCTGSFMFFWAASEAEVLSIQSYYVTKFFRFLVSLRKITQLAQRSVYSWVPMRTWDRIWTDTELFEKYGLTEAEADYIESIIRPMNLGAPAEHE